MTEHTLTISANGWVAYCSCVAGKVKSGVMTRGRHRKDWRGTPHISMRVSMRGNDERT